MAMSSWKRVVLVSASAGAGFALVLSLIVGGYRWYESRPKPWNTSDIKATFDHIGTESEDNTVVFFYILENTTDSDYELIDSSSVVFMARLQRDESLSHNPNFTKVDYPIFIPAKNRLRVLIHIPYSYELAGFLSFMRDPEFLQLSVEAKRIVLRRIDQDFTALPNVEQERLLDCVQARRQNPEQLKGCATPEQWEAHRKKLAVYVNKEMPNLAGFVLFDKRNRYQIDFPKGW
jgi:hypothetical protein